MDFKQRFVTTTAMALTLISGYGRRSYSACVSTGAPNYLCSGANNSSQNLYGVHNANVTTTSDFSVNTNSGRALTITGDGALSFIDTSNGTLQTTAASYAIHIIAYGNNGVTPGSVLIDTNSDISGYGGIFSINFGVGSLSITTSGDVTGANGRGINTRNYGTDLSITTAAGTTVSGRSYGIYSSNVGSGALSITADGNVIATNGTGIVGRQYGSGLLSIVTSGDVTGTVSNGIFTSNSGAGSSTSITIGGNVSGANLGISSVNNANATDLLIETAAGTTVSGTGGIRASNQGHGTLSITANGNVTATSGRAIEANNLGTDLIIETGSGSVISSGGYSGIFANNNGSGKFSVTIGGDVSSNGVALRAVNYTGTDLTIDTLDNSTVSGINSGIYARNGGSGNLAITIDGDVSAVVHGITARNFGTDMTIENRAGSTVSGGANGMNLANRGSGSLSVTNHGTIRGNTGIYLSNMGLTSTGIFTDGVIEGTSGTAILFQPTYSGYYFYQSTATPIEIAGGRIIGNVVDQESFNGFSPVTVTGDFISEGSFQVSDFNVSSSGDFTLSSANSINSFNSVDIDGIFRANGGSVTNNLAVNSGGTLNVAQDFAIGGNFTNNGSTFIGTGKSMYVNNMSAGTGDLTFGFNTVNDHALLSVTNGAANLTGQNITIDVTGVTGLATGEQALLVTGIAPIIGGPGGTAIDVNDTSVLWDFSLVDGTGVGTPTSSNDLFLIARQTATPGSLATTANNEHAGNVLMSLQSTTNPELALIVGNMNGASTSAAFNEILESTQAVADSSERATQTGFINYLQDVAGNRLDEIRSLSMPQTAARFGMREDEQAPQILPGLQVWGYGFGAAPEQGSDHGLNDVSGRQWLAGSAGYTRQGSRQGIDGFDAVSGGAVFGIDTGKTYNDRVFGLAVGYGHAQVNSKNANRAENEIDSLQFLAYASKTFSHNYYGELKASYAQSSNDTTRYNVGGVPGLAANGDFTSKQAGLQASVGKHILHNDYLITPEFGVNWLHYTSDGYTETGAGGANLTVDTKDADSIEIGGSVRVVKEIKRDNGTIILPEIRAGYYYDLSKDPIQKTVSFAGGGGSFLVETPNPSQHRVSLGAGVTVKGTGSWDYSLNYNLNLEQQFQDHSLVARASWKF